MSRYIQSRLFEALNEDRASTVRNEKKQLITATRNDTATTGSRHKLARVSTGSNLYHLRVAVVCCIIPGEIDDGGLATRMPVLGLTMGIAYVARSADGWCIFMLFVVE
jgi:hypothetical protein